MLPEFLALVNPASTIANPACMKNTSAAAMSTASKKQMSGIPTVNEVCRVL